MVPFSAKLNTPPVPFVLGVLNDGACFCIFSLLVFYSETTLIGRFVFIRWPIRIFLVLASRLWWPIRIHVESPSRIPAEIGPTGQWAGRVVARPLT
jgi:FlaA1/EpsC-like NDP-sugar epimerase